MGKAKSIEKGEKMNEENKKWFDDYKSNTNFMPGYYQKLENFLKYPLFQSRPFNSFTFEDDIEKYLEIMLLGGHQEQSINTLVGAINGFKNYLISNYPTEFGRDFLHDLPHSIFQPPSSDAFALNLTQINLIREHNKQNMLAEYIFEIFFQLGIKKKELILCQPNNLDKDNSCFKNRKGKVIRCNLKILELIEKLSITDLRLSEGAANYHFGRITDELRNRVPPAWDKDRSLNYLDIIKSHERYIVKCPSCGGMTENIAKYWILAKLPNSADYRITCSTCKGDNYGN
jgi:DNA-binding ferritin-like protein (Dps family)